MKAIQITVDEGMLEEIDRHPEARKHGRSALVRRAVAEYLRRCRATAIDEQYRRAYEAAPQTAEEIEPWLKVQAWPKP